MTQPAMSLTELTDALRGSPGFAHKRDISDVMAALGRALPGGVADMAQAVAIGDDCAAIPDPSGEGWLLFAIEGLVEEFVARMPWFAGYCGLMVNVSDICAMGGRPIAVVDALWSDGADSSEPVLDGLAAASARYGVPIVGGHSNHRAARGQLAVAVLGRARKLITSFDAQPDDDLILAVDLRGAFEEPYPYWNASTRAPAERLRGDIEILPRLAEDGLCDAGKDVSMAGAIGSALMLLECSGVGAQIDLDTVPRPDGVPLLRWLLSFPSFGYVLSVRPQQRLRVLERFAARGIAAARIGRVTAAPEVWLTQRGERALLWNVKDQPFIRAPRETIDV
ncbi:MAG: sll0787 family AIR synthase-like protein [Methyloversatilis discipulorum]|uniref:sll0787 family AIR synthase-like protein n=1 Tax=Methyloversatilis discipulorum TaxID=1119528 RepID=UPI0026EDB863|nr:sll0787 family AIR synthase-like protein [Methyloversatilis discipulorum]MBT9515779.1 sll0787 family AIR synthase-like protein [Methyloversatilis discipulorum]